MQAETEAQLLARCRRGDAAAWDAIFDRHYAPTMRFVFTLGAAFAPEDAEEICQETFLAAIRNLASFHGRSQFQTWLFRIAVNKARDYRERQNAIKRGGGQIPLSLHAEHPETGLFIDPPSSLPGPDGAILRAEQAVQLHEALNELGGPCQEIIELRYFAELSYEEISADLELNPKTVSSRLSKCLDRLEQIVKRTFLRETSRATSVQ
ncbi:MAG TPA: RNA polymerase sigma factor [Verrucomicrobiae bacterium]|nr:RNA polymerase sigma factor [Verrucomicrobiae bacterium]